MRVANPFALSGPTRVRNRMAMAYVGRCDEPLRLDCDRILSPMKAAAPSNAEVLIANARTWTDFALVRRSGANIRPDRSCRREPVDMADEDLVRGHDSRPALTKATQHWFPSDRPIGAARAWASALLFGANGALDPLLSFD